MSMLIEIMDAMANPPMRHAAVVHFPVALATLGAPVVLGSLARGRGRRVLQLVAIMVYGLLFASTLVAMQAGHAAKAVIRDMSPEARGIVADHETLASWIWVVSLGTLTAIITGLSRHARVARVGVWASAGLAGITASLVGVTAHHGGTAVYAHGVGIPDRVEISRPADTAGASLDPRIDFARDRIQPLLATHCVSCHGSGGTTTSGLDFRSPSGWLIGGTRGAAVVPGRPEESVMMRAVRGDGMPRMPFGRPPLGSDDIEAIDRWIRDGAAWPEPAPTGP